MTRPPQRPGSSRRPRGALPERAGVRAEPLVASWRPADDAAPGAEDDEYERPRPRRGFFARYGWRLYALPLLLLISMLVVFQTVRPGDVERVLGAPEPGTSPVTDDDTQPIVTEAPPVQGFAPQMFTAELPPGGEIPETGARTFQVLPGTSPVIGSGRLYRYTVEVEVGMKIGDPGAEFGNLVQATLSDPRSWTNPQAGGISLQRVDASGPMPDFRVILVSQQTAREACGYSSGLPYDSSCRKGEMVYLNVARWVRGAVSFEGDMSSYRQYAINHEVGHVFGNQHVGCPTQGGLAPVMMQQSFSVANNELNQLNQVADQGAEIKADGFVCRPNAWPFPVVNGS